MTISDDTHAHTRRLPHLQREGKSYFVTFRSANWRLPAVARNIVLSSCVYDHLKTYWLDAVVIMPDHVHMLITPYENVRLSRIMNRVKNASAHRINAHLRRSGAVWQREYFDHILRSDERTRVKGEYIVMNPVRSGLVDVPDAYPWIYRSWIEGDRDAAGGGGATPTPR